MNEQADSDRPGIGRPEAFPPAGAMPFRALLEAAEAASEDDFIAAIEADAAALRAAGAAVLVDRYASAVDLKANPRARAAVIAVRAASLEQLESLPAALARRLAQSEIEAAEATAGPGAGSERPGAWPAAAQRRAGLTLAIWTPIQLVFMFFVGVGATIATLYWMGIVDTAERARLEAEILRYQEQEAKEVAEGIAEEKDKLSDDAVASLDDAIGQLQVMPDGEEHLAEIWEQFVAFQELVVISARQDRDLPLRYSRTRVDDLIMPALRILYLDEQSRAEIREALLKAEARWQRDVEDAARAATEEPPDGTAEEGPEGGVDEATGSGGRIDE